MLAQTISKLVDLIYTAAGDPSNWPAALKALTEELRSGAGALLQFQPLKSAHFGCVIGTEPSFNTSYEQYYIRINPWARHFINTPEGRAYFGHQWVSPDMLHRTEFYQDWLRPQGFEDAAGLLLRRNGTYVALTTLRAKTAGLYTRRDAIILERLIPHVQNALVLNQRLAVADAARGALSGALDRLNVGVALVDHDAHVLFANRIAERVFRRADALFYARGQLRSTNAEVTKELERLLASVAATSSRKGDDPGGVLRLPRAQGSPLTVLVCPARAEMAVALPYHPAAILFISDPSENPRLDAEYIGRLYDLTRAETRLLNALLEGKRLQDYAEEAHISMETARGYLRQLFAKTGSHRQSDLIRKILSNPVLRLSASGEA